MNDVNILQKEKGRHSFGVFDLVIAALVVSSLAFYDVKTVFLGLQAIAFFWTFLHVLNNTRCLKNHIVIYSVWLMLFAFYGLTSILWAARENTTAIMVTLSGIFTLVRPSQSENALSPILVTESGMCMLVRL